MKSFSDTAEEMLRTIPAYKSVRACKAAITRINRRHKQTGSYGNVEHLRREVIYAAQDRCHDLLADQVLAIGREGGFA